MVNGEIKMNMVILVQRLLQVLTIDGTTNGMKRKVN
jgi:hypothetical protein